VIESKKFAGKFGTTILAGIIIADINIFSAEPNGASAPGFHVTFQPQYTGELKPHVNGPGKDGMILENFYFPLKPQYQGLLPTDDPHGLVT
jgi:hypothetical protein